MKTDNPMKRPMRRAIDCLRDFLEADDSNIASRRSALNGAMVELDFVMASPEMKISEALGQTNEENPSSDFYPDENPLSDLFPPLPDDYMGDESEFWNKG